LTRWENQRVIICLLTIYVVVTVNLVVLLVKI
jgi:hypothetical protein